MSNNNLFINLNEEQNRAVLYNNGPSLIFAGAGTGKTMALTTKIAYLLNNNMCEVKNILAVTFTNKAAKEMKDRVNKLIKNKNISNLNIGTFHKICCKIIRVHLNLCGLDDNFTIIDKEDQINILKDLIQQINFSKEFLLKFANDIKKGKINYKNIAEIYLDLINKVKNGMIKSSEVKREHFNDVFEMYNNFIHKQNKLDFNDLILKCIKLLENHPDIKKYYNDLFKFILVDEYQDTNEIQNKWIFLISGIDENKNKCITCVGDDDQSIYSWRGAKVENILNFSEKIQNSVIYIFNKNYRSTQNILNISNSLISHNKNRYPKKLISTIKFNNNLPILTICNTKIGEVKNIVKQIKNLYNSKLIKKYNQIAILIRSGKQSKLIGTIFKEKHLPYYEIGKFNFFQRNEIKYLIYYIKLIFNKNDDFAFKQIINKPERGIGKKTLEKIFKNANNISYFKSAEELLEIKKNVHISNFLNIINELNEEFIKNHEEFNINEIIHPTIKDLILKIIEKVNYFEYLKKKYKGNLIESRKENIEQLIYMTKDKLCIKENIIEFLEYVSLETKEENEEKKIDNKVIISTIHKAKGLEYDYVFLPFWNQNSFPNFNSLQEKFGKEEERRLAYVAITRAKKNVFISYHKKYIKHDKIFNVYASDFINEIPRRMFNTIELNDDIKENEKYFFSLGEKRNRENITNNNNENEKNDESDFYNFSVFDN